MLTVIQRDTHANVVINNEVISEIQQGIVALVAIEKNDTEIQAQQLIGRVLNYRLFADEDDKMNLSLHYINSGLLLIPQFTLTANNTM
ncbi:MAG: D-aminoacyl-tRNA deacylase [Cycloclasticus sp.]